jgi:hypothetical protein
MRCSENQTMPSFRSLDALTARGRLPGLLLAIPLLLGVDDNYLREIEDEAKRQAAMLITSPPPATPTAPTAPSTAKTDRLAAGLDPAAFEQALRQSAPDVYTVYQQLDANRKRQVYQAYQNNSQITSISERVAQLRGGNP